MDERQRRLQAVIKALRGIRKDVAARRDWWNSRTSDRWIDTLYGFSRTKLASLRLADKLVPWDDYVTHLDASIAFLETHQTSAPALPRAASPAEGAIDADFKDISEPPPTRRWLPRLIGR